MLGVNVVKTASVVVVGAIASTGLTGLARTHDHYLRLWLDRRL